jgi:MFS transporter, CP family, cyanate transporter
MIRTLPGLRIDPALLVIAAGVSAAIHVAKLPPALPALREALDISLVQAGFLISLAQVAGMALGLVAGLAADTLGLRRVMVAGLCVLSAAAVAGGFARDAGSLLALRGLEGVGFLLATMPAPGLIRRLVPDAGLAARLGLWGTYMPLGTALALLAGPSWVAHWGWSTWWWMAAALSGAFALAVHRLVPADGPRAAGQGAAGAGGGWAHRLARTLRSAGPWLIALSFAVYSAQWLAVIGFLPSVYAQAGLSPVAAGVASAVVASVNMLGNIASGRLLQRGVPAQRLLQVGFATMAVGGLVAYAPVWPAASLVGVVVPFLAVSAFSLVGGLIPGTLFSLAIRLAPGPETVSTSVGWMQQLSSVGQFVGPPLVAWVASVAGGWSFSGLVTASFAVAGLALAHAIGARIQVPERSRRIK